jgi:hypothetical protein
MASQRPRRQIKKRVPWEAESVITLQKTPLSRVSARRDILNEALKPIAAS